MKKSHFETLIKSKKRRVLHDRLTNFKKLKEVSNPDMTVKEKMILLTDTQGNEINLQVPWVDFKRSCKFFFKNSHDSDSTTSFTIMTC